MPLSIKHVVGLFIVLSLGLAKAPAQSKEPIIDDVEAPNAALFVEIELTPGTELSLKEARSLPQAPGSHLSAIAGTDQVRLQISAKLATLLQQRGIDFTITRQFVLYTEQVIKNTQTSQTKASTLSIQGTNETDLAIPEGAWDYSIIEITGAPAGATVSSLDVYFDIRHSCVGDVQIDLTNSSLSIEQTLKEYSFSYSCQSRYSDTVRNITTFNGQWVNQQWLLWAADWYYPDTGRVNRWWIKLYYDAPTGVPSHDESDHAIALEQDVTYSGSTVGATGQTSSECSYSDTRDVWHSFTSDSAGVLTLSTEGSILDTTLTVYDPDSMIPLACNDDYSTSYHATGYWSQIMMPIQAEKTYLVRVAGYENLAGDYQITAILDSTLPTSPNEPSPGHQASGVSPHTPLQWSLTPPTRVAAQSISQRHQDKSSLVQPKVIYGKDDRTEDYQIEEPNLLALGDATAMMTYKDFIELNPDEQSYQIIYTDTMAEYYYYANERQLCMNEPFRNQPVPGSCTGFLVAPDIVATAGHCISCSEDCEENVFIFGFVMEDAVTPRMTVDVNDVYSCQEILGYMEGIPDWALIRLDRPVEHITPIDIRRYDFIEIGDKLVVTGHPYGLPLKYDQGGEVRANEHVSYFQANLDTYSGNSGSPVYDQNNLQIQGILVSGQADFAESGSCDRSDVLLDEGPYWEKVTRATTFSAIIPCYDVYLGTDPQNMTLVGSDLEIPSLNVEALQPNTTYTWQVIAKNASGYTEGPLWTFTTES